MAETADAKAGVPAWRARAVQVGLVLALVAFVALHTVRDLRAAIDDRALLHLSIGREIARSGVPASDPFSFPSGGRPWVDSSWLSDVVGYGVYRLGGVSLVAVVELSLLLGTLALVHLRARARARSPWAAVPIVPLLLLAIVVERPTLAERFSLLALAATLLLLDRVRGRRRALVGVALAVTLGLAGELDGGFAYAFVVVALWLLGELSGLLFRGEREPDGRAALVVSLALLAGVASFAAHPLGFRALVEAFAWVHDEAVRVVFLRGPFAGAIAPIHEVLLLGAMSLAVLGAAPAAADALAALVFTGVAVPTTRGGAALSLVLVPILVSGLDALVIRAGKDAPTRVSRVASGVSSLSPAAAAALGRLPLVLGLVLVLLGCLEATPLRALNASRLENAFSSEEIAAIASRYGGPGTLAPLEAERVALDGAAALARLELPGAVWNDTETGGAFLWRLFPARQDFCDERVAFEAGAGVLVERNRIRLIDVGWDTALERNRIDLALVWRRTRLAHVLKEAGWSVAHDNGALLLLVRPGSGAAKALGAKGAGER